MYRSHLIIYNETLNSFQFLETESENFVPIQSTSNSIGKIWSVHHWYWFLYWELYCDHQFSQNVILWATIGSDITYFMDIILFYFPPLIPFAAAIAILFVATAHDFMEMELSFLEMLLFLEKFVLDKNLMKVSVYEL